MVMTREQIAFCHSDFIQQLTQNYTTSGIIIFSVISLKHRAMEYSTKTELPDTRIYFSYTGLNCSG
jgi:hypothetical protein